MRQRFAPALPANPWNWIAVWRRNFLVWRKVALASILGNLAEPMSSLFGLGFGLGMIIGGVDGTSYISFLAAGMIAISAMVAATFETIYAAYARMQTNCMWEAVLCTPLTLGDIVLGELAWAASKALLAGTAITIVVVALGYAEWSSIPYALPAIALTGLTFASLAMVVAALAPSHDYFIFYQSLILTPMMYLSGTIFPVSQLPGSFQRIAAFLPLTHSVDLIRPAMLGRSVDSVGMHMGALCLYAAVPFVVAAVLLRRRLMR
ncbi:lipooligosaccharide transport system permease protein [Bradyrhizobium sp. S3.12.5]|uniref:ABC transporter permease n=1 Tax=Bradyrhizobium sp. S3.12.5 TaxID=3156386 RepID=UPI003391E368